MCMCVRAVFMLNVYVHVYMYVHMLCMLAACDGCMFLYLLLVLSLPLNMVYRFVSHSYHYTILMDMLNTRIVLYDYYKNQQHIKHMMIDQQQK